MTNDDDAAKTGMPEVDKMTPGEAFQAGRNILQLPKPKHRVNTVKMVTLAALVAQEIETWSLTSAEFFQANDGGDGDTVRITDAGRERIRCALVAGFK